MDRDHLTRLIDDPARVQRDDIADLKAMAERYPWFSGAHLLLAVGGHREGDVLFDEQLRASAAHLPSRAVLFDKLRAPQPFSPLPVAPLTTEEPPTTPGSQPEVTAPPNVEEPAQDPGSMAPEEVAIAPVQAAPPSVPAPIEPPLPEHIPTPWKERLLRGDRDEEELDRQMRDSAVAISYELLLEREGLMEPPPTEPVAPAPTVYEAPPPATVPQDTRPRSRSFSDWLSEGTSYDPSPTTPPRKEIVRAVQQSGPVESKHSPETPETKALIERFLQQNAQQPAPPKKAEFFHPQTAAKRSLEEHADLVTETLARIYEKQGNIAKAIAAYERLAMKHPEKSLYFRGLAKKLEGK